jgi:two-component system response regulator RegX3
MVVVGGRIHVLVVDDEESYRQALSSGLALEGFEVEVAADGAEALHRFHEHRPDIVLLDMLLPGMHGIEVCRRMRGVADVPVIMVSAVDTELDVVLGLELGAAGYVTKPFHLRELVARMGAVLRRVSAPTDRPDPAVPLLPGPPEPSGAERSGAERSGGERPDISFGRVVVDFVRRGVTVGGVATHLSRREFDLLAVLLSPARRVRTRDELIDLLWPDSELSDTRTLDTHIHRLRAKLEPNPAEPQYIITVRGVGFRIDPDGRPAPPPPRQFDGHRDPVHH